MKDHGIGALLPYVRYFFPDTPVVPIAVSITSTREQWEQLITALDPIITRDTLILQSTDYSHYLTHHEAIRHDQQVLNVIASGDMDAVAKLLQPAHLDSRGAQYIQMRLQEKHFGSRPVAIANKNSQDYASGGWWRPRATSCRSIRKPRITNRSTRRKQQAPPPIASRAIVFRQVHAEARVSAEARQRLQKSWRAGSPAAI